MRVIRICVLAFTLTAALAVSRAAAQGCCPDTTREGDGGEGWGVQLCCQDGYEPGSALPLERSEQLALLPGSGPAGASLGGMSRRAPRMVREKVNIQGSFTGVVTAIGQPIPTAPTGSRKGTPFYVQMADGGYGSGVYVWCATNYVDQLQLSPGDVVTVSGRSTLYSYGGFTGMPGGSLVAGIYTPSRYVLWNTFGEAPRIDVVGNARTMPPIYEAQLPELNPAKDNPRGWMLERCLVRVRGDLTVVGRVPGRYGHDLAVVRDESAPGSNTMLVDLWGIMGATVVPPVGSKCSELKGIFDSQGPDEQFVLRLRNIADLVGPVMLWAPPPTHDMYVQQQSRAGR